MDYISNILSMDADKIFKAPGKIMFKNQDNKLYGKAKNKNIEFNVSVSIISAITNYHVLIYI